ncbi:MAG TPA: hypothetical protein VNV15_03525 [Opitutaceae bacterium]|nr:hypothetical protein [Opitutaceae bacterium]
MKSVAILVFFFGLAGVIFYYGKHSKKEPVQVVVLPSPPAAPLPAPKAELIIPDLKEIHVKNGRIITNARVQTINSDGIVFICDRGMVEALFDDLPPEFRTYYAGKAEPVYTPEQPMPAKQARQQSPIQSSSGPSQVEIEIQRAQDKANSARLRKTLENWIADNEETIHRYETQSSFSDPHHTNVTDSEYELAKAHLEEDKLQLQQLENSSQN